MKDPEQAFVGTEKCDDMKIAECRSLLKVKGVRILLKVKCADLFEV